MVLASLYLTMLLTLSRDVKSPTKWCLPESSHVLADWGQVVHDLPLIEAEAIRLNVFVVVFHPLQARPWDHSCFNCPLTAAV